MSGEVGHLIAHSIGKFVLVNTSPAVREYAISKGYIEKDDKFEVVLSVQGIRGGELDTVLTLGEFLSLENKDDNAEMEVCLDVKGAEELEIPLYLEKDQAEKLLQHITKPDSPVEFCHEGDNKFGSPDEYVALNYKREFVDGEYVFIDTGFDANKVREGWRIVSTDEHDRMLEDDEDDEYV